MRERREDIPILVDEFIKKYNALFKLNVKDVSEEVLQFFISHNWPGNVRELEHVIEASMNLINYEDRIEMHHLPYQYRRSESEEEVSLHPFIESNKLNTNTNLTEQLALFEKQFIEQNLMKNGNHITNTAKSLGISRQSLQYRMKRLNIRL